MPTPKTRAVCLLSGGLDSATLLHQLLYEDFEVMCLSVDYGQRHLRELASADAVAKDVNVPLLRVHLGHALAPVFGRAASSQVGRRVDVPEGHYAAEGMSLTIVPNRNMMLLSVAGALAVSTESEIVAYAAHAGDHPVYPDCRPEFIEAFSHALRLGTDGVTLYGPFSHITKADIVARGHGLRVPYHLTYSCYKGGTLHCGRCSTCVERREAFALAGVVDPTEYLDKTEYWKSVTKQAT